MQPQVFSVGENHQILNSVVIVNAIDVMNVLPRLQLSTKMILHYLPVFRVKAAGNGISFKGQLGISLNIQCGKVRSFMPCRMAGNVYLLHNMEA